MRGAGATDSSGVAYPHERSNNTSYTLAYNEDLIFCLWLKHLKKLNQTFQNNAEKASIKLALYNN